MSDKSGWMQYLSSRLTKSDKDNRPTVEEKYIRCKHGMVEVVSGRCDGCYIEELEAKLAEAEKRLVLYKKLQNDLIEISREWESHPDNWCWPCACKDCMSCL